MTGTDLEEVVIKIDRIIGTAAIGVSAFEKKDAFCSVSPEDVAGLLETIEHALLEVKVDLKDLVIEAYNQNPAYEEGGEA